MDIAYQRSMALDYLNSLREDSGMSRYYTNNALQKAASAHAKYLVLNQKSGHYESEIDEGYSGETPKDRVLSTNYQVGLITENVTVNSQDYKDSVDKLFAAIYHRFGFLDFQSDEIGIGVAQDSKDGAKNAFVYDMGVYELNDLCTQKSYSGNDRYVYGICKDPDKRINEDEFQSLFRRIKASSKKVIIYPYEGQEDVPPAFYNETPDPLPEYDVSGFPISIQFNDYYYKEVQLLSFKLFSEDGEEIPTILMDKESDPNRIFKESQYALFPTKRLSYNSRYRVIAKYEADGKKESKSWSFSTKSVSKPFVIIDDDKAQITIKPHTLYTIYFRPKDAHDLLSDLHFPADIEVKFLDQNTITLKLNSNNHDSFVFRSGGKSLTVHITQ